MSVEEKLRILSERIKSHSSAMITEEAVKTAVVLPFFSALGYDVFDPNEVVPEFTCDAVGKKGEKVDYAIRVGDKIRLLVECKPITTSLDKVHLAQLYRYFSVTSAKFAILTNVARSASTRTLQNQTSSTPSRSRRSICPTCSRSCWPN